MFVQANQVFQTIFFFKGNIVSLFWKKETYLFFKKRERKYLQQKAMFPLPSLSSKCLIISPQGPIKPSSKAEAGFQMLPTNQNSEMVTEMSSLSSSRCVYTMSLTNEPVSASDATWPLLVTCSRRKLLELNYQEIMSVKSC